MEVCWHVPGSSQLQASVVHAYCVCVQTEILHPTAQQARRKRAPHINVPTLCCGCCAGEEEDSWPKKGMREKLSQRLAASDSRGSTDETGSGHHHHHQHHSQHLDRTGTPPLPPHSSTH
jgi:hypothetical protein